MMQEITTYRIITGSYRPRFESDVNDALANGWKCEGGVATSQQKHAGDMKITVMLHQAMTKTFIEGDQS